MRLPREAVALAVDRQDVFGVLGIALELLPEPEDVSVDRPSRGEALVTPHLVEQALTRQNLPPVLDQVAKKVELLAGEPDLGPGRRTARTLASSSRSEKGFVM